MHDQGVTKSGDEEKVQSWLEDVASDSGSAYEHNEEVLDPALISLPRSNTTKGSSRAPSSIALSEDHESKSPCARGHNEQLVDPTLESLSKSTTTGSILRTANSTARPENHRQEDYAQTSSVATTSYGRRASSQAQAGATNSNSRANSTAVSAAHDSLWQLQNAGKAAELRMPLPSSRATSVATLRPAASLHSSQSRLQLEGTFGDSLLQLQNAGEPAELRVPLPASPSPAPEDAQDYWARIEPLLECLPDLRTVSASNGRYRNKGSVTCMDYIRSRVRPRVHRKLKPGGAFEQRVGELKHILDPQVITRYILIEDLSPEVISCIGSVFEVDPELFAEHINRSGYGGMDYGDPLPSHWMSEAHISLKWYRPVKQHPKITQWLETPRTLLDLQKRKPTDDTISAKRAVPGSIPWSDSTYGPDGRPDKNAKSHQVQISTNIFRSCRTLSTRPSTRKEALNVKSGSILRSSLSRAYRKPAHVNLDSETSWTSDTVPTAWEEKASFFRYNKGSVPISTYTPHVDQCSSIGKTLR